MRLITNANLNCIETGFGFGRLTAAGGMGDALRVDDALQSRFYCAPASAAARSAKHVGVRRVLVESACGSRIGHTSVPHAHLRPRQSWRRQGPTVSPSLRIS